MRRADLYRRLQGPALVLACALGLAACGSSPKPAPEPRLRVQAQEAEAGGLRRYAQGEYLVAATHFGLALRVYQSLDDSAAVARNRLQLAQAWLAQGRAQPALEQAELVLAPELQLQTLLLQAQARLALNQPEVARSLLGRAETLCASTCSERGRLLLLQARVAWAADDATLTLERSRSALPLLRDRGEVYEVANAWRLMAAALLRRGETPAALAAAHEALELDRQLALPEKIARDWLLIGDIQRRAAAGVEARAAYQRSLDVAQAAGLKELVQTAEAALKENTP